MLKWSKYNLVFRSKNFGLMLYNALTNRLMNIRPEFEEEIPKIKSDPSGYDFSNCFSVFTQMIKNRVLVGENVERDLIDALKMRKLATRFDSSRLALTLMVTENCNFGCPYCYEKNKRAMDMSSETMDKLIEFIETFKPLQQLIITWFGGEPLMRFEIMQELNRRFKTLNIPYNSSIITNGWLLTDEVAASLDELKVGAIQVTIDGPPEIHNKKRFHLEHGGSFDVIQANLDRLIFKDKWSGQLKLNYVIDETNADFFGETYEYWMDRYKGYNVQLGVSFADLTERGSRDMGCSFGKDQEIAFYIDHYKKNQGKGLRYYPKKHLAGCCATHMNAFVVGAEGQLYKCWDDVGKKEMEIGSIYTDPKTWNNNLIARYMVGVEPFDNPSCRECFYLPVCDECPNIWYRKKYKCQKIRTCSNYKNRLPEFLEIHHEMARKTSGPIQSGVEPASRL